MSGSHFNRNPRFSLDGIDAQIIDDLNLKCNECALRPSREKIDALCDSLSNIMISKAKECGICKEKSDLCESSDRASKSKTKKPWFDIECKKERDNYYRVKNKLKFIYPQERLDRIRVASKRYKAILKRKKSDYFKSLHKRLRNLKSNNSKEYWKFLNDCCQVNCKMSPIEFLSST